MKKIIYKCLNKECEIEFKDKNKDGLSCPICKSKIIPLNCNPTDEELAKAFPYETDLGVTVSLTNSEEFKQSVSILSEFLKDSRIDPRLRSEYKNKCANLLPKNDSDLLERIGFINVSLSLIKENPEGMIEAFKDILITDVKFDIDGVLHYRGVSKNFDKVNYGEKTPTYNILCSRSYKDGEENCIYKYEKVNR